MEDYESINDSTTELGKGRMPGAQSDMQSEGSYMVRVGGHKVINDDDSSMFGGSEFVRMDKKEGNKIFNDMQSDMVSEMSYMVKGNSMLDSNKRADEVEDADSFTV